MLLIENINDGWFAYKQSGGSYQVAGSITDDSFMFSQYVDVDNVSASVYEAREYFKTNFTDIVNSVGKKQKGTIIRINYMTTSYIMSFSGSAKSDGELVVTTKGVSKTVSVTNGMTQEDVAKKVYEYAYEGYDKKINNNVVTLIAQTKEATIPTIDAGQTGIEVQVLESTSSASTYEWFYGHTESDFTNIDNWKEQYISLYSLYKGIIEYIQENKPNAEIIFVMPSTWNLNYNDANKDKEYRREDGSYDIVKLYNLSFYLKKEELLRQIQTEVSEFYSIKYVNCHRQCGITPYNISEFYNPGDVHPKQKTYTKWAEEIYKLY